VSSEKLRNLKVRDSFGEAAASCGVSISELKLWLVERSNPTRWANWKAGREPIPQKLLLAFLMEKRKLG